MISVIIASVNKNLLEQVSENIKQTIGMEYELLAFDNSGGKMGLCEVYNLGVQQARYELLCFMHEDVEVKTQNWGQVVLNLFKGNEKLGLIGLAGSSYKAAAPSGWFCNGGPQRINYVNLLQRYKFDEKETYHNHQNPKQVTHSAVVTVDGVWFCTPKSVALNYPFDEQTFKKFHCYDVDFALSVTQSYEAVVTFEVLLEHFSEGNYSREWVEETLLLYKKWKGRLPRDIEGLNSKEAFLAEKYAFRFFMERMKLAGYSKLERLKVLLNSEVGTRVSQKLWIKLLVETLAK